MVGRARILGFSLIFPKLLKRDLFVDMVKMITVWRSMKEQNKEKRPDNLHRTFGCPLWKVMFLGVSLPSIDILIAHHPD